MRVLDVREVQLTRSAENRRTAELSHNGTVVWRSRTYDVRATGRWRQHDALFPGDEPLVELEVTDFGKQPVALRLAPSVEIEPGLVLFACWLCQRFVAQNADAA